MDTPATQQWFLRKQEDGNIFGPLSFTQLLQWASSAQVAPNDSVSNDALNWMKAPMVPGLEMDWIVEITSEQYYGPTTLGSINEFTRLEEIDDDTFVINARNGKRQPLGSIAALLQEAAAKTAQLEGTPTTEAIAEGPAASGISIGLEDRIRELEQALREERRSVAEAEDRYRELELRYSELLGSRSVL